MCLNRESNNREYRRLERSGLQLSALSFGSWVTFHGQIEDKHAGELMGIAYDRGSISLTMQRPMPNWDRTSYVVSSKASIG